MAGPLLETWPGGDPEGPLVVFLPGCPDSRWAAWLGDAPARGAGVRLVSVNRPGYGAAAPSPAGHRAVAESVCRLADQLGADRFGLLGMSVGGTYALACAALHPDRVSSVVTVSSPGEVVSMDPPHHRDGLSPQAGEQLAAVRSAAGVEEAVALLRPEFAAYAEGVLVGDGDADLVRRWLDGLPVEDAALLAGVPVHVLASQARESLADPRGYLQDASAMLRPWEFDVSAVSCPVRVVHGTADEAASPRNARWLAENVPGAELCLLPGVTHLGALHGRWAEHLACLSR